MHDHRDDGKFQHICRSPWASRHAGGQLVSGETVRVSDIKMEFRISDPERGQRSKSVCASGTQ